MANDFLSVNKIAADSFILICIHFSLPGNVVRENGYNSGAPADGNQILTLLRLQSCVGAGS